MELGKNLTEDAINSIIEIEGAVFTIETQLNDLKSKLESLKNSFLLDNNSLYTFLTQTFSLDFGYNIKRYERINEKIDDGVKYFEMDLFSKIGEKDYYEDKFVFVNLEYLFETIVEKLKNPVILASLSPYVLKNFVDLSENSIEHLKQYNNYKIFEELLSNRIEEITKFIIENNLCYEIFCNETDRNYTDYYESMYSNYSVYKVNKK